MKHTQSKNSEARKQIRMFTIFLIPLIALIMGIAVPELWANDHDDEEVPFDEAHLFFELNNTDGDLGIHALIDGEAWKRLEIEDTRERKMLNVFVQGRLRRQGLTEIFFESAEPTFDELSPRKFFRRFPKGIYEIEGATLEGEELESEVELTHVMPAPAGNITVNGITAGPTGDECNEEDPPKVSGDVVIVWDPVTTSHPTIGESDPEIEIIRYQAVAEWEDEEENVFVTSIDLPAPVSTSTPMSVTIPSNFFRSETEFKVEVLVREESYNQTAAESCPFEYE